MKKKLIVGITLGLLLVLIVAWQQQPTQAEEAEGAWAANEKEVLPERPPGETEQQGKAFCVTGDDFGFCVDEHGNQSKQPDPNGERWCLEGKWFGPCSELRETHPEP